MKGRDTAYPIDPEFYVDGEQVGLTKREWIAALIYAGMFVSSDGISDGAVRAVKAAEELIVELDRGEKE